MRQLLKTCVVLVGLLFGAVVGCQGLLGIEDATLRSEPTGGASGAGQLGSAGNGMSAGSGGEGGDGLSSRISYQRVAETFGDAVLGADGNFWLTTGKSVMRVTLDWDVTDFPLPEGFSPTGIALGVDGNVWASRSDRISRITPAGVISEFPVPSGATARWICSGPGDDLWFIGDSTIGKISLEGELAVFTGPPNSDLWGIAAGDDGTIWITDKQQNAILSVATDGTVVDSWAVPTSGAYLGDIEPGPDKNLWFLEGGANKLGKIVADGLYRGMMTEYPLPAGGIPSSLVAGPDGALWITLYDTKQLIRVTTNGEVTDVFALLPEWKYPASLLVGPDGNLWFGAMGNLVRFEL
jgi:virginiamycin B lyase